MKLFNYAIRLRLAYIVHAIMFLLPITLLDIAGIIILKFPCQPNFQLPFSGSGGGGGSSGGYSLNLTIKVYFIAVVISQLIDLLLLLVMVQNFNLITASIKYIFVVIWAVFGYYGILAGNNIVCFIDPNFSNFLAEAMWLVFIIISTTNLLLIIRNSEFYNNSIFSRCFSRCFSHQHDDGFDNSVKLANLSSLSHNNGLPK